MSDIAAVALPTDDRVSLDADALLNALDSPIVAVSPEHLVLYVNIAAEQLFGESASQIVGQNLEYILPKDTPIHALVRQVQGQGISVSEYGLTLETARVPRQLINIQVSELSDHPGVAVINIFTRSIADKIDRQMTHRNAARSVTAMAAMLAHEVKNPLSGIRGAAQLLEQMSEGDDQTLTQLICDETDRICSLVDRIEVFSDQRPLERAPVNIHQVLERVKNISQTGFAKNIKIVEHYDPSLPSVDGNHDQLVQIFLNLLKNAAEAAPAKGGEVVLSTAYQHSVRFAVSGSESMVHLPLVISVQDNGEGIPQNLQDHLFDAFVTSKPKGTGLGLALVAKMVDDHGGVIEFDSNPGKTVFRVRLPMAARENEQKT